MNTRYSSPDEERVAEMLREVAKNIPTPDPEVSAERVIEDSTDSFFSADSPLGRVYVAVSARGVRLVAAAESGEGFARYYRERFGRFLSPATDEKTSELREKVEAALAGERIEVPLDLSLTTPFQRRVMEIVRGIPRGEARPYNWVAREAGNPRASRAVGTVMANNPVPLLVPCHRVIRNDGSTGNYGFGPGEKVRLLNNEGVSTDELARAPYVATPTTGIVCHATCSNAKRIKSENRRSFRSVGSALDAGYRPCKVCRPVEAA